MRRFDSWKLFFGRSGADELSDACSNPDNGANTLPYSISDTIAIFSTDTSTDTIANFQPDADPDTNPDVNGDAVPDFDADIDTYHAAQPITDAGANQCSNGTGHAVTNACRIYSSHLPSDAITKSFADSRCNSCSNTVGNIATDDVHACIDVYACIDAVANDDNNSWVLHHPRFS